jgi:pathogenesis-related protein 1
MYQLRNPRLIIPALILWNGAGLAAQPADAVATLTAHNMVRSAVRVPDLVWSEDLATIATDYAATLEQQGCPSEPPHSPASKQGPLGENLYWASPVIWNDGRTEPQQLTPKQVVDTWAAEKVNYNYQTNTCTPGEVCGHYTQLVWAATTEVGCGYAVCANNSQVWVCNYSPPGNVSGQKPY